MVCSLTKESPVIKIGGADATSQNKLHVLGINIHDMAMSQDMDRPYPGHGQVLEMYIQGMQLFPTLFPIGEHSEIGMGLQQR